MWNILLGPTCWLILLFSFLSTLVLTPALIVLATRFGIVDNGGYRKIHRRIVPLLGGLAIALPFLILCNMVVIKPAMIGLVLHSVQNALMRFAICAALVVMLGVLDDVAHLSSKMKFAAQFAIALLYCLDGSNIVRSVNLPFWGVLHLNIIVGTIITVLWLVGVMNAFNLVDGVDGLATSLALISAAGLGIISAINGILVIVVLCLGLVGCLSAFLIYNFHPARIFLGDTGSLFLGFVLAALSIGGGSRASGAVMLVTPMMVLALPIFDTLTSMARRILRGHDPFFGDRRHTHHRLLGRGLSQRQVAFLMGGVSLLCTVAAILAQTVQTQQREFMLFIGLTGIMLILIAWLNGYLKVKHAMRLMQCRARNSRLKAVSTYVAQVLSSEDSRVPLSDVMRVACLELGLDFLEISRTDSDEHFWQFDEPVDRSNAGRAEVFESIRVEGSAQEKLLVRYRLAHCHTMEELNNEAAEVEDRLEHEDVAVCLARLFGTVRISQLVRLRNETQDLDASFPSSATIINSADFKSS